MHREERVHAHLCSGFPPHRAERSPSSIPYPGVRLREGRHTPEDSFSERGRAGNVMNREESSTANGNTSSIPNRRAVGLVESNAD